MKTYYELLGVAPTAEPDEIKRAFRREISRYHPDKVQHLGTEFQEIAATRAAELTEAYRILMDPAARQEYDAGTLQPEPQQAPRRAEPPPPAPDASPRETVFEPPPAGSVPPPPPVGHTLRQAQETMTQFVKKATIGRLREAVDAVAGELEPLAVEGFDAAYTLRPRRGLFQKGDPPIKLLARMVPQVSADVIADTWPLALRENSSRAPMVCVLLLGLGLAPARELAASIAEQRRRTRQVAPVFVPVDTRDWNALLPPDTPAAVRQVLDRMKLGS